MTAGNLPSAGTAVGKMKYSFATADHGGWYRLDGRAKTALPLGAQAAATSIGIGANLPNAANRLLKWKGTIFSVGGDAVSVLLTQANLPVGNAVGSSTTSPNTHTHALTGGNDVRRATGAPHKLPSNGAGMNGKSPTISAAGAHVHAYSIALNNAAAQTPLSVIDKWVSASSFIYLG